MKIKIDKRDILGKKVKTYRRERKVPGVVMAKDEESLPVVLDTKEFLGVYKEAGETALVDIEMGGDDIFKVVIRESQVHPVTGDLVHINLYKVNLKEKIRTEVPIEFVGEPEIVKNKEAILLTLLNEVEVESLPGDIPHSFVVDTSQLEDFDSVITVADLKYDKDKVEFVDIDPETPIVKLDYAEMLEVEEEEEAPSLENIEATAEKGEEEGEGEQGEAQKKQGDKGEE